MRSSLSWWHLIVLLSSISAQASAGEMPWVRVAEDKRSFVLDKSEKPFVPWGFNYDHDENGRLLEDYWEKQWPKVEQDFQEMRQLGANVVRIHLQTGKFMEAADQPSEVALQQLGRLVALAERNQLYLDLTGLGCYHKEDVPPWYDQLDEQGRWAVQARFWEAVAQRCAQSPAIFCYDLMNEPVVPGGERKPGDWLGPPFGRSCFVQFITLKQQNRPRPAIAQQWCRKLAMAIRKQDQRHLVTVGLVHWSLDRPGLTSGFVPKEIAPELDFIAVHLYPEKDKIKEAMETLSGFAVDKPVIIEEMFPLKCSPSEFEQFLDKSKKTASGWIGFYWGRTAEEYRQSNRLQDAVMIQWLELFTKRATILTGSLARQEHPQPIPLIFDTDIMGDVDDVGAVAVLHALADQCEVKILAMGVSAKNPWSPLCLDALNTYFGRAEIPLGVVKGPGFNKASKYAQGIAEEFPHRLRSADDAPDATLIYREVLAKQPDHSVIMVSVGQLTNFRNLLKTIPDQHSNLGGMELVKRKVKAWVCMGGKFPEGREANLINDGPAAAYAIQHWPTPIIFSGWEIGNEIMTGAGLREAPAGTPVRRGYELYNGLKNRQSWDQTAVLYAVRGLDGGLADYWDVRSKGHLHVNDDGGDVWQDSPVKQHSYLVKKLPPEKIAEVIEELMLRPRSVLAQQSEYTLPPVPEGKTWKLVWHDEFDGTKLDETKWDVPADGRRKEGWWMHQAISLDGKGHLVISTLKEGDKYLDGCVRTKGTFEHAFGYYVARIQLQKQQGHWSAFWINGPGVRIVGTEGRDGAEIDIMEKPWLDERLGHAVHWDGYSKEHKSDGKKVSVPGVMEGFHTFGLWWQPDQYIFYVDGKETWRTKNGVSQKPEFILLSDEVGKWGGDITKAKLPDQSLVDYVRVYDLVETK